VVPVNTRRSYRSTIRRGDAPQAILTAAAKLFRTKGYLATSIDDIAAEAGVARPTVFAAVGPKPALLKLICGRVADLLWAVESAAAADADAAALWADLQEQRRTSMRTYVRALARKTELREDVATITDSMWAMIPALYLRLVRDAGWSPDRFETWLGETFIQLWLP